MEGFSELIGRFHPVLIHLPIGILILSVILIWVGDGKKNISNDAIRLSLGVGAFFATLSCVTGFFLWQSGSYDKPTVQWHQWMGISTATVSVALWRIRTSLLKWTSAIMLIMIVITGHLGASLTHGSEYLTAPLDLSGGKELDLSSVNYDTAIMYQHLIAPILDEHCRSCHGPSKQKGRLRLDSPERIMTGGKNGAVVRTGNPQESEVVERLRLPRDDEHHMPPKERRQPDDKEIGLLSLWIESGASFRKPLREILTSDEWKSLLASQDAGPISDVPQDNPGLPNQKVLNDLRSNGVAITPISENSNYLQVSFISVPEHVNDLLPRMEAISANIIWLKLGNTALSDSTMQFIGRYQGLTRLGLERTNITDKGVTHLKDLQNLRVVNLSGTQVSMAGLRSMVEMKGLRSLNIYQTLVLESEYTDAVALFPQAHVEMGGYEVPTLDTDTTFIK